MNHHSYEGVWISVPRDPTPEMVQAMEDRMVEGASYIAENSIQYALWVEVYRAMLRAAPKPTKTGAYCPVKEFCDKEPVCVWPCDRLRDATGERNG